MVGRLFTAAGTIRYKRTSGCGRGGGRRVSCAAEPGTARGGAVGWGVEPRRRGPDR